jgi:hypothetical protein
VDARMAFLLAPPFLATLLLKIKPRWHHRVQSKDIGNTLADITGITQGDTHELAKEFTYGAEAAFYQ